LKEKKKLLKCIGSCSWM